MEIDTPAPLPSLPPQSQGQPTSQPSITANPFAAPPDQRTHVASIVMPSEIIEPVKSEPVRIEPVRIEPAESEPAESEPAKRRGLSTTARVLLLVCGAATVLTYGVSSVRANEQAYSPPAFDGPVRAPGDALPTSLSTSLPTSLPTSSPTSLPPVTVSTTEAQAVAAVPGEFGSVFTDASGTTWESGTDLAGASPIGLDVPLTQDDLMPDSILGAIADTSVSFSTETGTTATQTVDLGLLRFSDPAALAAWAESVGFVPADLAPDLADVAVITMAIGDDGDLTAFVIHIEALDQQVSYERVDVSE